MVNEFREMMEAKGDGFGDETFTTEQIKALLKMGDFKIVHEEFNLDFCTPPRFGGGCYC